MGQRFWALKDLSPVWLPAGAVCQLTPTLCPKHLVGVPEANGWPLEDGLGKGGWGGG